MFAIWLQYNSWYIVFSPGILHGCQAELNLKGWLSFLSLLLPYNDLVHPVISFIVVTKINTCSASLALNWAYLQDFTFCFPVMSFSAIPCRCIKQSLVWMCLIWPLATATWTILLLYLWLMKHCTLNGTLCCLWLHWFEILMVQFSLLHLTELLRLQLA